MASYPRRIAGTGAIGGYYTSMATDWGTATDAEVALLYKSVRIAVRRQGITMARFYALASDEPPPGPDYERNFRRGRIARRRVVQFIEWLEYEYPDLADALETEIDRGEAGIQLEEPWEQLVAQRDDVDPMALSIARRSDAYRDPNRRVKINREPVNWIRVDQAVPLLAHFAIEIQVPFDGPVYGFQWSRRQWWDLGLSSPEIYETARGDYAWFPAHPDRINRRSSRPDFFVEREHPGINRLALVIVKSPLPEGITPRGNRPIDMKHLNRIAAELIQRDRGEWRVMNRVVQFYG